MLLCINPSSSHIKVTRQLLTQQTRQSILESPSHQTYLGNATSTTLPIANSTLAFLRRNIRSSPSEAKAKAYNTYVRPSVEYASSVWSSAADSHLNQLEMVQRRAARFVRNDYSRQSSVTEMVTSLHLTTLQKRRDMARVTMLYNIKHNLIDVTPDPPLRSVQEHQEATHSNSASTHANNLCTRTASSRPPSSSEIPYPHKKLNNQPWRDSSRH